MIEDPVLLEATDLRIDICTPTGRFSPVDGVSLSVSAGESLGIVGESGSGKTLTLRSLIDLLPANAEMAGGEVSYVGESVRADAEAVRGTGIAMVFQEPMAALNPVRRIGLAIMDAYRATHGGSAREARRHALQLMREVGIPAPEERLRAYPHQLSGGLRQRVMIAMALAGEPRVLLCDEPTTALDVTLQRQIVDLLNRIRSDRGLALIYVTHDLAVIGDVCDRVAVMYAGRIVEIGPVPQVFGNPAHPYTHALLGSAPSMDSDGGLVTIPGSPPDPRAFPRGCRFRPRCPWEQPRCADAAYELAPARTDQATACVRVGEIASWDGVPRA